jgi:choline-sulfatase
VATNEDGGTHDAPPEILRHALGCVFREAGYETVYGGKTHLPSADVQMHSYGFRRSTRDEREELARDCADFLRQKHSRPFLLVASFINPHDICYMAIDAASRAQGRPLEMQDSIRERQCLAEALRLPAGVSRAGFFQKICPPLPKNFGVPRDEPSAARQTNWPRFRTYVQDHWTAEDWRLHRWAYARLVERADAEIGVVLDALRQSGLENDTLVVFTSDHGEMDASHKLEQKAMPYEEATRVPLIISRKGVTPAGRVDATHLVSTGLDLIPTLCDLAGIATPAALKGRSVKPLVMREAWEGGKGQKEPLDAPSRQKAPVPLSAWRECLVGESAGCRIVWTRRFMYAVYDRGRPREFLVDLERDPGEMVNLAVDPKSADVLARHRALLREWYPAHGETLDPRYIVR